ncbi:4-O-beta-D-mannosyl-D-glucose phosphorylase [Chitinophaga sp. YR627]|uniref:glycoside hydrolase family 130 protein n=1 Tax=Chitinophaga sp. YR627 TaxID=1881041 RepID=UPI0008E6FC58|nr:glycosidase [Chitinophaga sp. YR627]SFO91429.1 4-O-beta-D-mannosyl-D-glucose phosphorylase [Chitinophaga sp. YR627]
MSNFNARLQALQGAHQQLIQTNNEAILPGNGIFLRYKNPVLTAAHVPLEWCYDFNQASNPYLMTRFGINAVFNAGAIKWKGKYIVIARVEGWDRKSFFAIAESDNGTDGFRFREFPIQIPETAIPDTNIYDMRVVLHEDGYVYGLFCTERRDPAAAAGDQSAAIAQCGIVRTKDLKTWERLPDLVTASAQQRNVVLHPEFVNGKYMLYTRPQDGFIEAGKGGGIGVGYCDSMEKAVITTEAVIDNKMYHTIAEAKNGQGPAPIRTPHGWLHLAHGVRNTAAGLRYTLYLFMTSLDNPEQVIYKPAGYFMAPEGDERIGDVSNVLFSNGWIADEDGQVFIYYASSDTRLHVATSSVEQLTDYCMHTVPDGLRSFTSVAALYDIIEKNKALVLTEI